MTEMLRPVWDAMLADGWTFLGGMAGLLALVGLGEGLRLRGWAVSRSRNVVHAGVGIFVALTPLLFASPIPVYAMAGIFVIVNALALWGHWWPGIHGTEASSVGTVTFPLVLIPALAVTWSVDPDRIFALQTAFLVLAFADPMAAWIGTTRGKQAPYKLGSSVKSVPGSIAFGLTSWIVATSVLLACSATGALPWPITACFAAGFIVAVIGTAVEALSGRGWDNFFVVIAVLAVLIPLTHQPERWATLMLAVGAGGTFALASYTAEALDASGAVAGGLLAATLVGLGGWAWIVPGLVFFVLSSALSRIGRRLKHGLYRRSEKGDVRDAGQVYANGGIAWGVLLMHAAVPNPWWFIGFLGAFAAAAADTWATELGALSPRRPRLLRTGERVPRGTSGAVSVTGLLASVGGAASIGVSAAPFLAGADSIGPAWSLVVIVVASGVLGALADSVVGATVQAQYRDPESGDVVERPVLRGEELQRIRGWAGLTNDRVNWIGTAVGALAAGLGAGLLIG